MNPIKIVTEFKIYSMLLLTIKFKMVTEQPFLWVSLTEADCMHKHWSVLEFCQTDKF